MNKGSNKCGLVPLMLASLRLGMVGFGGLGAALKLMQRDLVERRRWLTTRDLGDALAYTKPLPGSTVVQIVAFLGWRLRRWPGAVVATLGFLAPAMTMMTTAAALTYSLPDVPWVRGALTGLQVAVAGLLIAAMWQLAKNAAGSVVLMTVPASYRPSVGSNRSGVLQRLLQSACLD